MTKVGVQDLQNIQMYLQQAGVGAIGSSNKYMNTIWGALGDLTYANSNDPNTKAYGWQNLVNKALSLIAEIAGSTDEAKEADKEVKENSKDAKKLKDKTEKTEQDIKTVIDAITAGLNTEIGVINQAIQSITNIKEDQDGLLKQIKTIQEQIEAKQEKLKQVAGEKEDPLKPGSKKDKQVKLLEEIGRLSGKLLNLATSSLPNMQETLESESQKVAQAYTNVELLKGNAIKVQQDGEGKLTAIAAVTAKEIKDNTASATTATTKNTPTATAAKATAETTAVYNPGQSANLFRVSIDNEMAASIRLLGGQNNLASVTNAIGGINTTNKALTGFSSNIQEQFNQFDSAIGQWNENVQPMIVAIGSISVDDIKTTVEELNKAVANDLSKVNGTSVFLASSNIFEAPNPTKSDVENNNEKNNTKSAEEGKLETPNIKLKFVQAETKK